MLSDRPGQARPVAAPDGEAGILTLQASIVNGWLLVKALADAEVS